MKLLALALLALLLAAPALAGSGPTIVRTYEAPTLNLRTEQPDPLGITADGSIDVGGVRIPSAQFPLGARVADIAFADLLSRHVRGLACQDLDGDYVCGQAAAGEPRIEFCDTMAEPGNVLYDAGIPLQGGADLVVFVFAGPVRVSIADPSLTGPAPCPRGHLGHATQGTVAVTLAP